MSQQDYEKSFYGIPNIPTSINNQKTQLQNVAPREPNETLLKEPLLKNEDQRVASVAPKIAAYIHELDVADELGLSTKGVTLNRSNTSSATELTVNVQDKYLMSANLPNNESKANLRVYRIAEENNFQAIVNVTRDLSKKEWHVHETPYKMNDYEFETLSHKMPSITKSLSKANREKQAGMER